MAMRPSVDRSSGSDHATRRPSAERRSAFPPAGGGVGVAEERGRNPMRMAAMTTKVPAFMNAAAASPAVATTRPPAEAPANVASCPMACRADMARARPAPGTSRRGIDPELGR